MKKKLFFSVFLIFFSLSSSWAVWEGNAAVGNNLDFSESGLFVKSDMFPQHTLLKIVNLDNDKVAKAIVIGKSSIPGLLLNMSPNLALKLNIDAGKIVRVRVYTLHHVEEDSDIIPERPEKIYEEITTKTFTPLADLDKGDSTVLFDAPSDSNFPTLDKYPLPHSSNSSEPSEQFKEKAYLEKVAPKPPVYDYPEAPAVTERIPESKPQPPLVMPKQVIPISPPAMQPLVPETVIPKAPEYTPSPRPVPEVGKIVTVSPNITNANTSPVSVVGTPVKINVKNSGEDSKPVPLSPTYNKPETEKTEIHAPVGEVDVPKNESKKESEIIAPVSEVDTPIKPNTEPDNDEKAVYEVGSPAEPGTRDEDVAPVKEIEETSEEVYESVNKEVEEVPVIEESVEQAEEPVEAVPVMDEVKEPVEKVPVVTEVVEPTEEIYEAKDVEEVDSVVANPDAVVEDDLLTFYDTTDSAMVEVAKAPVVEVSPESEKEGAVVEMLVEPKIETPIEFPVAPYTVDKSSTMYEGKLEKGKFYLQIANYKNEENVKTIINKHSKTYPIVVETLDSNKNKYYRVFVGPLAKGEMGAAMQRFYSFGFKDSFFKWIQ